MPKKITVHSSHGTLTADAQGHLIATDLNDDPDCHEYRRITQFRLAEQREFWKQHGRDTSEDTDFDILDLAYYYIDKDGHPAYEPASDYHRKMVLQHDGHLIAAPLEEV